ncbi:hypothetical protein [Micromonospora sonchi]|uniref:hypothetical protein n=1 Tax=Micromonospora sonchi TaxID=1763543 RepID=UPI00166A8EA1|nr:hypothetical protein [Micromonospora sonchi]
MIIDEQVGCCAFITRPTPVRWPPVPTLATVASAVRPSRVVRISSAVVRSWVVGFLPPLLERHRRSDRRGVLPHLHPADRPPDSRRLIIAVSSIAVSP